MWDGVHELHEGTRSFWEMGVHELREGARITCGMGVHELREGALIICEMEGPQNARKNTNGIYL